jgi:SAM-dependent methyltransferase
VHFKPDHSSLVYTKPKNGWVDYGFDFDNRHYRVPRTPLVCPRSLADIYYAPDHVRAWKAELYRKIGGHDINLAVGDDHDLLCRTYLANAKMVKIEQPLYMYREGEQNTYSKNLEKIREVSNANKDKYLRRMGERWCRDNGHPMIDMGAARAFGKKDGYLRLDISDEKGIDIVHDATKPLPWPDSSIGIFHCQDFLEHIPIGKTVQLMNEFYRCLVPGGWLHSSTPSTDGRGAFQDPTHVSFWNSNSFWYYTSAGHRGMVPEIKTEFQAVRVTNSYPGKFCETHKILYVNADLIAMKGQPQIGPVNF